MWPIRRSLISEAMNPLFLSADAFVVARDDAGEFAGCAQVRPLGDGTPELELASVFVRPDIRGQGVGTALVRECLRTRRAAQAPVFLLTLKTQAEFYSRLGFSAVPEGAPLPTTMGVELALGQVVR